MKKGIIRVNLSQSLRQGSLAASRTGDLPSGLSGTAGLTLLDTDTFFFQHPSPDSYPFIPGCLIRSHILALYHRLDIDAHEAISHRSVLLKKDSP